MGATAKMAMPALVGATSRGLLTERLAFNFFWLYKLRWTAVVGQMLTIAVVRLTLETDLPCVGMVAIIAATIATNVLLGLWLRVRERRGWVGWEGRGEWLLRFIMILDIVFLTGLLYLSGGPTNPFTVFYLINIALAAVLLDYRWTWVVCGLALLGYAVLFVRHVPVACLACADTGEAMALGLTNLHLRGMLIAFGAASSLVVYFISRINQSLSEREEELARIREQKSQNEKLDALATLAAGAAHELASPLSTIAVVARELEIELEGRPTASAELQDIQVIRTEIDRCRQILDRMATAAGETVGEEMIGIPVDELIEAVVNGVPDAKRVATTVRCSGQEFRCRIPKAALSQSLRAIVQNALDASPEQQSVAMEVEGDVTGLSIVVSDTGDGMAPEILHRAGEPFFTTKEPGKGMGLGLFLARRVIERLGGTVTLDSSVGAGTVVTVHLPLERTPAS